MLVLAIFSVLLKWRIKCTNYERIYTHVILYKDHPTWMIEDYGIIYFLDVKRKKFNLVYICVRRVIDNWDVGLQSQWSLRTI